MTPYLIGFGILAIVGYLILAGRFRLWPFKGPVVGSVSSSVAKEFERLGIPPQKLHLSYVTPRLTYVRSNAFVPEKALELIDEGIANQIRRHSEKYPHWTRGASHNDYAVLLIDPMATNQETEPGSPALLVNGIQTAGTCVGKDGELTHIVAPHQDASGWVYEDYFMRTIWHESEHIRENWNDDAVFMQYVGGDDTHPHVP